MNERLKDLFDRYYRKTISPTERDELFALMADPAHEEQVKTLIMDSYASGEKDVMPPAASDAVLRAILSVTAPEPAAVVKRRLISTQWAIAASVALVIAAGTYLAVRQRQQPDIAIGKPAPVAAPLKEGPMLTLADGSRLSLDSLQNGVVASDAGADIAFNNEGLSYDAAGKPATANARNTITTPRGRQFRVVLSDGTQVWLNAASSLHFPAVFTANDRSVEVTGEAYFEVAEQASAPFRVITHEAEIQVLGTHFNVNAYPDAASIKTTLLQGSVRVKATASPNGASVVLLPGQQARVQGEQKIVVNKVDAESVMAWRNGIFNFDGIALKDVMDELSRWYDIEVVYEQGIPDIRFFGELSRNLQLADVIKALEESKVRVRMDGNRRLVVLP